MSKGSFIRYLQRTINFCNKILRLSDNKYMQILSTIALLLAFVGQIYLICTQKNNYKVIDSMQIFDKTEISLDITGLILANRSLMNVENGLNHDIVKGFLIKNKDNLKKHYGLYQYWNKPNTEQLHEICKGIKYIPQEVVIFTLPFIVVAITSPITFPLVVCAIFIQ